jgi:hypothetical protein
MSRLVPRRIDPGAAADGGYGLQVTGGFVTGLTPMLTLEDVRDDLASVFVAGPNIVITPNDVANTITIESTASGGGGATTTRQDFVATAGQTAFTLSEADPDVFMVSLNGQILDPADYAVAGTTLTLDTGAELNDGVSVFWNAEGGGGGGGGGGGSLQSITAVGSGAGDYTATSATMVDIHADLSAVIPAAVGDVLVATFTCSIYGGTSAFAEVGLNIGGTLRRSNGITAYSGATPLTVQVRYVVEAGDISGGNVTVKPQWKKASGSISMINDTTDRRPTVVVINSTTAGGGGGSSSSGTRYSDTEADAALNASDAWDENFSRTGAPTTIPASMAWVNQGSATFVERDGIGWLTGTAQNTQNHHIIEKTVPAGATWTIVGKFTIFTRPLNYWQMGISLRDSGSGRVQTWDVEDRGLCLFSWNSPTSYNTESSHAGRLYTTQFYLRVKKNSATSYELTYSENGQNWLTVFAAHNPTFLTGGVTHIGFHNGVDTGWAAAGLNPVIGCHYLRKVA